MSLAIIVATGPFLATALAWIWLKEIPHRRTMLASAVALVGVVIIVGGARAGSDVLGVALAIFMALAIAAMTVMVRRHRNTPMIAAAALSNFLGSAITGDGRGHRRHRPGYEDAAAVTLITAPRTAIDTAGRTARR